MNEWGLIRRPQMQVGLAAAAPATPMTPGATAAIGGIVGAALGFGAAKLVARGMTASLVGAAVGAAGGGVGGYYYGKGQQPPASAGIPVVPAPPPTPVQPPAPPPNPATTLDVVLAPGNMTAIGLSLTGDNAVSFTLPVGASGSINLISADATIVKTSGITAAPPATATAVAAGSTTLQAAWNDANGNPQTSSIPITVTPGVGTAVAQVTLAPNAMAPITLSLSSSPKAVFALPAGATGTVNLLSADATIVKTTGFATPPTATAVSVGTTTLSAAWADAQGNGQTSTIPVTVTA